MGKTKKKSADFQKVKLKVGRSLPKGLNVTETKFKAKKIKVPAQFKPETSEPKTHKDQTVKDLLKRAQHSYISVRHDSFIEMGKLMNSHKELIEEHLSSLLQMSFSGFINDSSSIRKEAINLCCLILENVSELKISAFSSVLLPHVCCAMTSIHSAIRLDSLKVLDICLDAIPSVITSSEKILKNFLAQISYEKSQEISHKSAFKVESLLHQKTASDRLKSQNWRVNVLNILAKFLKVVLQSYSKKETEYFWPFYSPLNVPVTNIKVAEFSDSKEYFSDLMSVLFEIWAEAAPLPYVKNDSGEVVSAEAATVMDNVLKVICLICELFGAIDEEKKNTDMMTWFDVTFRKRIFGRLMAWFPYSQRVPVGKRKRGAEREVCLTVNLAICDVYSMMQRVNPNKPSQLYQQMSNYLLHIINCSEGSLSVVIKIVKNFLAASNLEPFESHLNGLFKRYEEIEGAASEKAAFLDFVTDLILDIRNKEWMEESLPMMKQLMKSLLQDVHIMFQQKHVVKHTLDVVKQLNVIGFLPFIEELQRNSYMLIDLFQSEKAELQTTAVYLISRLTHISMEFFRKLAEAIFNPTVPVKTINHLLTLLSMGLSRPLRVHAFTRKDFINFLLCVAVGMFKNDADAYQKLVSAEQNKLTEFIPFHLSEYGISASTDLHRQFDISQDAIRILIGYHDRELIAQCIHTYVLQFTTHCTHFPVHTALALLLLELETSKLGYMTDDIDRLLCISEITIALFFYQIALEKDKEPTEIASGTILSALLDVTKKMKSMRHVCEILTQRVRDVTNMEQIKCIGQILLIAANKQLLLPEDLSEVINEMHTLFGDDIANETWWLVLNHEINLLHAVVNRG